MRKKIPLVKRVKTETIAASNVSSCHECPYFEDHMDMNAHVFYCEHPEVKAMKPNDPWWGNTFLEQRDSRTDVGISHLENTRCVSSFKKT
jgi:hypothetical protein